MDLVGEEQFYFLFYIDCIVAVQNFILYCSSYYFYQNMPHLQNKTYFYD